MDVGGGNGPICVSVEQALQKRLNVKHVKLTKSCTAAMELAWMTLGIKPGDEIILPSFTYVSCATAILRVGAKPVFADVQPHTFMLDPLSVKQRVTKRTRAILGVHYAGFPCEFPWLQDIANLHGLAFVEDAAQAFGTTWHGQALGTFGDIGCFSFHGTKNFSCGEGGAFITNNDVYADKCDVMRCAGTNKEAFRHGFVDHYDWVSDGLCGELSDFLAQRLAENLEDVDAVQASRMAAAHTYYRDLYDIKTLTLPTIPYETSPNWHIFAVLAENASERGRILQELRAQSIGASFHFQPLHCAPYALQHGLYTDCPVAEDIAARLIRLPLHEHLTDEAQARIIQAVRKSLHV